MERHRVGAVWVASTEARLVASRVKPGSKMPTTSRVHLHVKVAVTTAEVEEESTTDRMNAPAACRRASHPPGSAAGDEIAGGSVAAGD